MFTIITPIAFVVLAVSASKEESIDVTRRLLGEDYNNGWRPDEYQSNYRKNYDDNDRNYGHRYDYDKYHPNYDYNNDKGYNKGWSNNDDKNNYGRYGATQGIQDNGNDVSDRENGLGSKYGGYGRGYGHGYYNDYYKRDYYHKPYYPRYWTNEGGKSDNDASRVLAMQDNDEAGDDNVLILASRYGGGYHNNGYYNNGYKRNYNRYNYYNDDNYGSYWSNEGGNPDDADSRLIAMDKEAGDDTLASRHGGYGRNDYGYNGYKRNYNDNKNDRYGSYWSYEGGEPEVDLDKSEEAEKELERFFKNNTLASRYGGYGRNDYHRYDRYNRYYRNKYNDDGYRYWSTQGGESDIDTDGGLESRYGRYGRNNYHNGDHRYYRNKYNDDYRYWSTQGGQDGNDRKDGYEGLASRYGHGNNYYNGWYKQKDDYYNKPNYGHYWANEGGNSEENNQGLIDRGQANFNFNNDDGVFEVNDDKEENEDD